MFLLYVETVYKGGDGRLFFERKLGVARISAIEPDQETRGDVKGRAVTFEFLRSALFTDELTGEQGFYAQWVIGLDNTTVTVAPATASVKVGSTVKLTATTTPAGKSVTWASGNEARATVAGGTVTGVSVGTVTITATADGSVALATITVTE